MEFQRKYDQIIYNICQLINKHKYKRALATAQHLQTLGFANHQLLVLKSYATAKLQGYPKALQVLQFQEGPLIQMAQAQYNQQLSQFQQAQVSFKKLIAQGKPAVIDYLAKSNEIRLSGEGQLQRQTENRRMRLMTNKKESECVQAINKVSQSYIQTKYRRDRQEIDEKEFVRECKTLVEKYENILEKHRPKKQLRVVIEQFIVYVKNM